jgi:hypothetical protein
MGKMTQFSPTLGWAWQLSIEFGMFQLTTEVTVLSAPVSFGDKRHGIPGPYHGQGLA